MAMFRQFDVTASRQSISTGYRHPVERGSRNPSQRDDILGTSARVLPWAVVDVAS
jgi:hypothetical protein